MLSQRQANAMLSMKPTVIYNPDVYRKWTNLFIFFQFFWGTTVSSLSLHLHSGIFGCFRQTLFVTHLRTDVDSEENR